MISRTNVPQKPKGRTFSEFLDGLGGLASAELAVLEACNKGELALIAASRPTHMSDEIRIRAEFLRFLVLGGDDRAAVHEKGVHISGAWIDGSLDLEVCCAIGPLTLDSCHVNGCINLQDAKLPCLFLDDCFAKSIDADRVYCTGSIHIHNGSLIDGLVSLGGAHIGGDLDCTGSKFQNEQDDCLACPGAEIKGAVILGSEGSNHALHAVGGVDFTGAKVNGDVQCSGCNFEGAVWFIGSQIGGDLVFSRARFGHGKDRSEIVLSRAEIAGRMFFRKVTGSVDSIILRAAKVGALVDDLASWEISSQLLLDGFSYDRFIDADVLDEVGTWTRHFSPTDAQSRIAWLDRQREEDRVDFKPQPWEQLIKVLREIGHQEGAKQVAIAKQKRVRKSKSGAALWHWTYGWLCGYGYRPGLLIAWALGFAVICGFLFKAAANMGAIGPADRRIIQEVLETSCRPERGGNWTTCPTLHRLGYPTFDPAIYSLDLIVPVIATQQTKDWSPISTIPCTATNWFGFCRDWLAEGVLPGTSGYWPGTIFWLLVRIENLAGWVFGLMFIAIISGWIKKD